MRITEKELQRFVQRLRQEEKSGATVEKYCREAARFACWLDGRDAVKDLALAYKAVLVRERAPAGVNGAVAAGGADGLHDQQKPPVVPPLGSVQKPPVLRPGELPRLVAEDPPLDLDGF